jgi:hypothetical protein
LTTDYPIFTLLECVQCGDKLFRSACEGGASASGLGKN